MEEVYLHGDNTDEIVLFRDKQRLHGQWLTYHHLHPVSLVRSHDSHMIPATTQTTTTLYLQLAESNLAFGDLRVAYLFHGEVTGTMSLASHLTIEWFPLLNTV